MEKQIRKFISKIRRDYLEHIFVSVVFLWVLLISYVLFGKPISTYMILIYIAAAIYWEIIGESEFDIADILVSIIPIIPALVFYVLL